MSAELEQLVWAYNRAPDSFVRTQMMIAVAPCHKYHVLDKFNEQPEELDGVELEITIDERDEEPVFNPPYTRYIHNKAIELSKSGLSASDKIMRQEVVKWAFSLECCRAIVAFSMSPDIMQFVAYG